ncbi:MAG: GNAT family N-acetyltransferase [Ferruginibacter sp.]
MTEVTTRRAGIADAEALAEISRQTFYDTFTGTCTEEDMQSFLEQYFNPNQVIKELGNENDNYYLAELNGEVIGYLRFMEDYNSFPHMKQWKALELKRIYINKVHHGKGVAQTLMSLFMNYAIENKYQVVWLGVWEHNMRAQKFYEKYDFVDSGQTHDFPIGNTPQTDRWFWKFV